jgi:hypothetical protein
MNHDTLKRDQRTGLCVVREIDCQLFSEESGRRNQLLCLTEAPQRQVSKTPTHRLADQQRACKDGNSDCYAEHDDEIGLPVVRETSFD